MERKQLDWEPEWEGSIEGWTVNFIESNIWRVERIVGFDDLLQEGVLLFLKCKKMYGHVTKPQHFMSLYQKSFRNRVHHLSNMQSEFVVYEENDDDPKRYSFSDVVVSPVDIEEAFKVVAIDAPRDVQKLITLAVSDAAYLLRTPMWTSETGRRETTDEYLCRLAGIKQGTPITQMIEEWVHGSLQHHA